MDQDLGSLRWRQAVARLHALFEVWSASTLRGALLLDDSLAPRCWQFCLIGMRMPVTCDVQPNTRYYHKIKEMDTFNGLTELGYESLFGKGIIYRFASIFLLGTIVSTWVKSSFDGKLAMVVAIETLVYRGNAAGEQVLGGCIIVGGLACEFAGVGVVV